MAHLHQDDPEKEVFLLGYRSGSVGPTPLKVTITKTTTFYEFTEQVATKAHVDVTSVAIWKLRYASRMTANVLAAALSTEDNWVVLAEPLSETLDWQKAVYEHIKDDSPESTGEPQTEFRTVFFEVRDLMAKRPTRNLPRLPSLMDKILADQLEGMPYAAAAHNDFLDTIAAGRKGSPSTHSRSAKDYRTRQQKSPILDGLHVHGRSHTAAPPVELYHPVFAQFLANARNPDLPIPEHVINATTHLIELLSTIVTLEPDREAAIREALSATLQRAAIKSQNKSLSAADGGLYSLRVAYPFEAGILCVIEIKGFRGVSGDPRIQGHFSYVVFWADNERVVLREMGCCPGFVVAISGSELEIMGCVITTDVVAQRLWPSISLSHSRLIDRAAVTDAARVLHSLGLAIDSLHDYYMGLAPKDVDMTQRYFPSINCWRTKDGKEVQFRYLKPLEEDRACITFLAQVVAVRGDKPMQTGKGDKGDVGKPEVAVGSDEPMQTGEGDKRDVGKLKVGQTVVVKFTDSYGKAAHELLAKRGFAPELFYCEPLSREGLDYGTRMMVVMEHIRGPTLLSLPNARFLEEVKNGVYQAVGILHEHKLVHGDLRGPNIMIEGGGDRPRAVKIIDFDWSGVDGEVMYPPYLSSRLYPASVRSWTPIIRVHDEEMLRMLFSPVGSL